MKRLLWLDIETTGLDFDKDFILEVAWRCSSLDLSTTSPLYSRVVTPQPGGMARLEANDFVHSMHKTSGLLGDMRGSDPAVWSLARIEEEIIRDMQYFENIHGRADSWHLSGASIHFDQRFIEQYMPELFGALHHRMLDTSSIKLLLEGTGISIEENVNPNPHRAVNDVAEVFDYLKGVQAFMTSQIVPPVEGTHIA